MLYNHITPEITEKITQIAHQIHRNPELSQQEFMTTGLLLDALEALNIELTEVQPDTGVIGLIRGGLPGPTVALRADIDALPVEEAPEHAIRSEKPGVMHACGHDFHTAALLGAAMALSAQREQLPGNVLLIFQPAEEPCFGADAVVATGVFETYAPVAFLSLHVMPDIPAGKVGVREGAVMAAQCCFKTVVSGKGGHGAAPHMTKDSLIAAVRAVDALQCIPSRWVDPVQPFALSVCTIHGGTTCNVIPDTVTFEGTCRFLNRDYEHAVMEQITKITDHAVSAHDCTAQTEFFRQIPALVNDPGVAVAARKAAANVYGPDNLVVQDLRVSSEDFSVYGQIAPTFMYFVGIGGSVGLHNAGLLVPDETAPQAAELLTQAAITVLKEGVQ